MRGIVRLDDAVIHRPNRAGRAARHWRALPHMTGLALLLILAAPVSAWAHGVLERSTPARGAHLAEAPRELRLRFTETPVPAYTRLSLVGPDSQSVALGPVRYEAGRTVVADITGALTGGVYTVVWQVAGADGHPVRGRYAFVIAPGASGLDGHHAAAPRGEQGGAVPAPGQAAPPAEHHDPTAFPEGGAFDAESPVYVAIRWLTFLALVAMIGAVAFAVLVLPRAVAKLPGSADGSRNGTAGASAVAADARRRAAVVGGITAAALLVLALTRLGAQSYAMHGPERAAAPAFVASMVVYTAWGWGWLAQLAGALVALAGFHLLRWREPRDGRRATPGAPLLVLAVLALAVFPPLSGHAVATERLTAVSVAADALHVIGAGGWLGSLFVLLAAGVPAALRVRAADGAIGDDAGGETLRGRALASLVRAFSPTALAFAGLVAATGLFAGWVHLGSLEALWRTRYGVTLLIKLTLLAGVAATGFYNWRAVLPHLGSTAAAPHFRRSAAAALAIGAVVLLVTAVLVATPFSGR